MTEEIHKVRELNKANKGVKKKQIVARQPTVLKNLSKLDILINCKEKDKTTMEIVCYEKELCCRPATLTLLTASETVVFSSSFLGVKICLNEKGEAMRHLEG